MKILYIDTTTNYLYTGIVIDNRLIAEVKENFGKDLSGFTLYKISEMLKNNGMVPNDIDKIIVVNGPGSFTGIRVGVTIAKTYGYSLNKDVITISSLEAMAISSKSETVYKIPIIDARRNFVYGAIYDKNFNSVLKDQYINIDTLKCAVDNLIDSYSYIGNDVFLDSVIEEYDPDIEKIVNTLSNRESVNCHAVNPIYLKQTEAEEKQKLEII